MAAVINQLGPWPSEHHHHHSAAAAVPTAAGIFRWPTSALKSQARAGAAASTTIRSATVSLLEDPSLLPLSRNGGGSVIPTNSPGWSSPTPVGNNGRSLFTKMEAGGFTEGESEIPRRTRKVKETKVVIMVDPVEAKRLAAAEMKEIQARSKRKRQKEIEGINGGWAVLGLTAGIVIEGYSGKSILTQIAGYLDAVADFLTRITPS